MSISFMTRLFSTRRTIHSTENMFILVLNTAPSPHFHFPIDMTPGLFL